MPDLNLPRIYHSTCALGDRIYAFGGQNGDKEPTEVYNSIEWLDAKKTLQSDLNLHWNLIVNNGDSSYAPQRLSYGALLYPMGRNEILITGGRPCKDENTAADAFLYDVGS